MVVARETAESFSSLCISAYKDLQMYKTMREYSISDNSGIWARLGITLMHHWVLQVAKINDPKNHGKDYNFSLAYFIASVNNANYTDSYNKFLEDNKEFIEANKKARVKVVAHRDLDIFQSQVGVGGFSAGLEQKYFDSLHEIISEGYRILDLGTFPEWPSFIVNETKIFMDKMVKVFGVV
jgi:hypothetical protein